MVLTAAAANSRSSSEETGALLSGGMGRALAMAYSSCLMQMSWSVVTVGQSAKTNTDVPALMYTG